MTIHERMVARSEREKDLLKYGRRQKREHIIKLLNNQRNSGSHDAENDFINNLLDKLIALIEEEN